MVRFFDIKVSGLKETQSFLSKLDVQLPKNAEIDASLVADDYKRGLKNELLAQDLVWDKILYNSIKKQKTGDKEFSILMKKQGVYLDRMRPHFAPLADPTLKRWVDEHAGSSTSKGLGSGKGKKGYIYVKPHPWIERGMERGRKNLNKRLENGKVARMFKKGGK
ncbi:MAG TPA: hypothetical protein VMX55_04085 [candidate division Zixibacteria bacterium]|nr:hypothetical protein [candidate division Zixibacteria bacterium]